MVAPPVLPNTGRLNLRPATRDLANLATRATTEKTAARRLRQGLVRAMFNALTLNPTATSLDLLADGDWQVFHGRVLPIPTVGLASAHLEVFANDLRARGYWVKT